jgi:hypothetical protein
MYPEGRPAFAAMILGTRYAAEASEWLAIYAGRTCGFVVEISLAATDREVRWVPIDCEEDRVLRAVLVGGATGGRAIRSLGMTDFLEDPCLGLLSHVPPGCGEVHVTPVPKNDGAACRFEGPDQTMHGTAIQEGEVGQVKTIACPGTMISSILSWSSWIVATSSSPVST